MGKFHRFRATLVRDEFAILLVGRFFEGRAQKEHLAAITAFALLKKPIGERLATAALRAVYNVGTHAIDGPTLSGCVLEGANSRAWKLRWKSLTTLHPFRPSAPLLPPLFPNVFLRPSFQMYSGMHVYVFSEQS